MRLIVATICGMLAACGPPKEKTEIAETKTDTVMSTPSADTVMINSLSETEKNEGWQLLFDGVSKKGWHGYLKGNDSSWKVTDSTLYLDVNTDGRHSGIDLVSDDEYENFHFKAEWKISKGGNSGILFLVKESQEFEKTHYTGPEMQVLDDEAHKDGRIQKHRAGDLYDLIEAKDKTVKPVGEWNSAEIIKKDSSLELRLNGAAIVKTTLWNEEWKKLVTNSKFIQWPAFGTFRDGRIALQDHGNEVWFRNIKIRKL